MTIPRHNLNLDQQPIDYKDSLTADLVISEVRRARKLHLPMKSCHEAYAVILEELDEFWEEVKKRSELRDRFNLYRELLQVAAMAARAIVDLELLEVKHPASPPAKQGGEA